MSDNAIRRWLRRRGIYTGRLNRVCFYPERSDLPEVPRANEIAIAGTPERLKWALLDCPCGRGHVILIPLSATLSPHWHITVDAWQRPSIHPSLDRNRGEGQRCHFWVRHGTVVWA